MVSSQEYAIIAAKTPGKALDLLDSYLRTNPESTMRDSIAESVDVRDRIRDTGVKSNLEGVLFPFGKGMFNPDRALECLAAKDNTFLSKR